jgi:hypothetical protein
MHFLVYQKMRDTLKDDPDLIVKQFQNRRELLVWALDNGVRLTYSNSKIIGPEGEERGTSDIRSEIARLDAEEKATYVEKTLAHAK